MGKNTSIFELLLTRKDGEAFGFQKYRSVNQLGRFFSVTLNRSVTRLYSTVSFARPDNLTFLQKYLNFNHSLLRTSPSDVDTSSSLNDFSDREEIKDTFLDHRDADCSDTIPLMFRAYQKG